jgi:hypothetical protein
MRFSPLAVIISLPFLQVIIISLSLFGLFGILKYKSTPSGRLRALLISV